MKNAEMEVVRFASEDVIATSDYILRVYNAESGTPQLILNGMSFTGTDNPDGMRAALAAIGVDWEKIGTKTFYDIAFDTNSNGKLNNYEIYFQYPTGFKKDNGPVSDLALSLLNGRWKYVGYDSDANYTNQKDTWVAFLFQPVN